jgi:dTDP-4-amino-4,6-dideoxygalactose transaminase
VTEAAIKDIPFGRPMVGAEERAAVEEAMTSPQLVHGPRIHDFEDAFAAMLGEGAYATAVSSCTAGLHLSYLHLGLGPGDEVIVPAETHVATAHAVEVTGAKPVFVDSDESGNIDVDAIEIRLSERTKAICVVHYPGLPVDVVKVNALARPRGLAVVEDCALAVGATLDGVACGLLGDMGSFSFYPVKHMTTGEGGMVVSRDPDVIASIASLKAFGYDRSPAARSIPGVYDIARLGINYRMSEMAAAIGLVQLTRVKQFAQQRDANTAALRGALELGEGFRLLPGSDSRRRHANYCLVAVLEESLVSSRNEIVLKMKADGVGTSVYYPVPLPLSHFYSERYGCVAEDFPNASGISHGSIALPVGPHLDKDDMAIIADSFIRAVQEVS